MQHNHYDGKHLDMAGHQDECGLVTLMGMLTVVVSMLIIMISAVNSDGHANVAQ